MASRPPPRFPGLFTLDLVARKENDKSKLKDRAESQLEHLGHNYTSLSLAARNLLAVLCYYGGEKLRAEKEFKVTLEQDPGNLNALHSLRHLYRKSARARLALYMERHLQAAMQRPLPLAGAQCLAEQAYAISFECFGRDSLAVCQVSTAWLEQAMRLAGEEADQEPQADSGDQGASRKWTTLAEWRLCMIWNLKKAFHRSGSDAEKQGVLQRALSIIFQLLDGNGAISTALVHCYLGYFLWKLTSLQINDDQRAELLNLVRRGGWMELLNDPALCYERALRSDHLNLATRNKVKKLFAEFLVRSRPDEATIQRLTEWIEETTEEQYGRTVSSFLWTRAVARSSIWQESRNMRGEEQLRLLHQCVEDFKAARDHQSGNPRCALEIGRSYNFIAKVHQRQGETSLERTYAQLALDTLSNHMHSEEKPRKFFLRELLKAQLLVGTGTREASVWSKRLLECDDSWKLPFVLKSLLNTLSVLDREECDVTAAISAAFWLDYACTRLGDGEKEEVHEILFEFAQFKPGFARKVSTCAENMRSSGELGSRNGGLLEDLRDMMGLQPGRVNSHVRQTLELDRSEFSPPEELSPRNVEGVTWDVGVVCAPEDVTWFRRGMWRYLVREFGMKVKVYPSEAHGTSESHDYYKVLVVMSASFWPWAERGGHVTWLRGLTWRDGAGLVREDAPPPPHLADLAILRRTVTPGDWSALLQVLW